jgi:hypothetical protein
MGRTQLRYSINIRPLDIILLDSEDILKVDFSLYLAIKNSQKLLKCPHITGENQS